MGARIAPPFMEATDASRLVCVVVVSYQEYSLTHTQFETATHQVIEWLPVRISLGPGFDWLHEAKWVENDEQVQWPALSWVGPGPCL